MDFKTKLAKNYVNYRGWNSKRKLVLFESDDWGSIRMPSKNVFDTLINEGVEVNKSYFTKYDSLESEDDLLSLFTVLKSFKDINGNHPSFTANALVANPDFDKIRESDFKEYHYERIDKTYERYHGSNSIFDKWKIGINERLLYPQFHGREHIGIWEWMKAIQSNESHELLCFDNKAIIGSGVRKSLSRQKDYTAAFDYVSEDERLSLIPIIEDGLQLFEETFGFKSKSFVAPSSIRGDYLDDTLVKNGVLFHQLGQQLEPNGDGGFNLINRYWGDKNNLGQIYWRRNVSFEPSKNPNFDWVNSCMQEIAIAFRWGKPAVINTHRVNFIGSIVKENRDNGLRLLLILLKTMLKKWPDIEFMSSDQLGDYMASTIKK
jgi:hypothetical protein